MDAEAIDNFATDVFNERPSCGMPKRSVRGWGFP